MKRLLLVLIMSVFAITTTKIALADWVYMNNISGMDKRIEEATMKIESELSRGDRGDRLKQAYLLRSSLYGLSGCYEDALRDLDKALEIAPTDYIVYNNIAWMLYKLADYHEALENVNRALELHPSSYFVLNTRALIYIDLDLLDEAMQDVRFAIKLNGKHGFSYFTRGIIYYSQVKKDLAQRDFQKAVILDQKLQTDIDHFVAKIEPKKTNKNLIKFPQLHDTRYKISKCIKNSGDTKHHTTSAIPGSQAIGIVSYEEFFLTYRKQ
ncbi:MAG: tetratricopeptide repeat protein [Candidatus Omnitrophota bacterium]